MTITFAPAEHRSLLAKSIAMRDHAAGNDQPFLGQVVSKLEAGLTVDADPASWLRLVNLAYTAMCRSGSKSWGPFGVISAALSSLDRVTRDAIDVDEVALAALRLRREPVADEWTGPVCEEAVVLQGGR